VEDVVVAI
jgi:uncharacterized protein